MLGDHGGDEQRMVRRSRSAGDSAGTFTMAVDAGFVPTMGLTLVAGKNLPAMNQVRQVDLRSSIRKW